MRIFKNKSLFALVMLLAIVMPVALACSAKTTTTTVTTVTTVAPAATSGPTSTNPIVIDKAAGEIRIAARVNSTAFTEPTWHAVVYEKGKVAGAAVFQSYANPNIVHAALLFMGGKPGNNVPMANSSSVYVEGSSVSVSVTWAGAPKTYSLIDVVKDPDGATGKGIAEKFGGNYDRIDTAGTGCLTCFYSCPVGITSNSAYNGDDFARQGKAGQAGFLANSSLLPKAGTDVVLIYKVTP